MSSPTTGFTQERQLRGAQGPMGTGYFPTEEEMRVLAECKQESFWYRSVPFSVVSMAVTQALVVRGKLSASPRFGSLPKLVFAGFFGYLAGKMSYMTECQQKFKRLENSPLGEALRQGKALPFLNTPQPETSDPETPSFDAMFQPAEAAGQTSVSRDFEYSYNPDPPTSMGKVDDFSAPGTTEMEDDEPRKKSILYEDLRLKNRENYEVTLTQKADTLLKPSPEKEPGRPKKEVKKNIYGDTWED